MPDATPRLLEPVPLAAFADPATVRVVEGEFVVLGPGGTGFSMTREAARETCRRLTAALREGREG